MAGEHWIKHASTDPYRRTVVSSDIVQSMGIDRLFALRLDCGHTAYTSTGKSDFITPKTARCRVCIDHAMAAPARRPLTLAEAAVVGYVSGASIGVIDAARAAIALEGKS